MKKTISTLALVAVIAALAVTMSCNAVSKDAQNSATRLIVQSVIGHTADGTAAAFLQSDVQDLNFATGTPVPFVAADTANITLTAQTIDPNPVGGTSSYNDITLTSFSVTYQLPGGDGVPGVDVPLPIGNSLSTIRVRINQSTTVPFIVVLESAKTLPPLAALAGTNNTLQVNALIEFKGQDDLGRGVTAQGNLTITFADFFDAPPPPPDTTAGTLKIKH